MPEVLVVRHAIAEPRDEAAEAGRDDSQRALTKRGAKRMRAAARGLALVVPGLTRIATSPLVRARQTADLLTEVYGVPIETEPALAADEGDWKVLAWVNRQPDADCVALVGHEPSLGEWASWMLSGNQCSFVEMKKAGVCHLLLPPSAQPGRARLKAHYRPAVLRELGSKG